MRRSYDVVADARVAEATRGDKESLVRNEPVDPYLTKKLAREIAGME